jgi:flagellar hook-associated protein 2
LSTIQFGGVISGLNTQGIIDALVAVKKAPLTKLQASEVAMSTEKAAYAQLGITLDDLITKIKSFTVTSSGAARVATSTDSTILTATAVNSASVAQYVVSVDRLATATRATSTTAIGSAVTGSVNTALALGSAHLATAVTAGQMAITVDGTTAQYTVGDPATTTIQDVMNGLAAALQAQIGAAGDTGTVSASIVGGHIQLAVTGNAATHTIAFGDAGDSSNLAAAFGLDTQGVSGSQDPTITGAAFLDPVISSLNLPGTMTAGQISAIVDGAIVHYTVGDPTKTSLTQMLNGFASAMQAQLRAGGANVAADPSATVTASIVGNKLQLAVGGAGLNHSLSFGSGGDASNALGILGLSYTSVTNASNPTITGSINLGVVRMTGALDNAGLSGLTSTKTGVLTINGVAISYDTAGDSLTAVVSRINNSGAGVIASVDRTNDRLILTRSDTGAAAIDIVDTSGNLGAALMLAPGTINAQSIGKTAQVTVDGRVITSASNSVTDAIDGVTLSLLGQSSVGETETLSVGVDQPAVKLALTQFIASFNALGDLLEQDTAVTPGSSGGSKGSSGPLASDSTARSMFLELRDLLFRPAGSGSFTSLGSIGISTGAIGSLAGTTNRLQLDVTALTSALNADPNQVAVLLDGTNGPLASILARLKSYEDPANTNAYVQAHTSGLTRQITANQRAQNAQQSMIDNYQAMLEAQYATMEATLAKLQAQSASISATLGYSTSSSSSSGLGNSSTG